MDKNEEQVTDNEVKEIEDANNTSDTIVKRNNISFSNYTEIAFLLEQHHELFYRFYQLGYPIFTDALETAAVAYDITLECPTFLFNPTFYQKLSTKELAFVISHECLHVTLDHCKRFKNIDRQLQELFNRMADVVVNETLVRNFGFERLETLAGLQPCYLENSFPKNVKPEVGREVEYYFNLLMDNTTFIEMPQNGMGQCIDQHQKYTLTSDKIEKVSEQIGEALSKEGKDSLKSACGGQMAGTIAGNKKLRVNVKTTIKRKWESVIKNWAIKTIQGNNENEQWARIARRMSCIDTKMFIPSIMEEDTYDVNKIDVWFFQDTSGSCAHFAERFFAAAKSLPPDKFNIKMFCFDTKVYETTLESGELYGFGGTSFDILERAIQREIKEKGINYPKAVFVITDGYGNSVHPLHPKKWYWFLSEDYKIYIPKECNTFMLKDFE